MTLSHVKPSDDPIDGNTPQALAAFVLACVLMVMGLGVVFVALHWPTPLPPVESPWQATVMPPVAPPPVTAEADDYRARPPFTPWETDDNDGRWVEDATDQIANVRSGTMRIYGNTFERAPSVEMHGTLHGADDPSHPFYRGRVGEVHGTDSSQRLRGTTYDVFVYPSPIDRPTR